MGGFNDTTGRLMLTVIGGIAQFERELIESRTSEGRERARRAGVKMGRKPILSPHQIAEIRGRKANGEGVSLPGAVLQRVPQHHIKSVIQVAKPNARRIM